MHADVDYQVVFDGAALSPKLADLAPGAAFVAVGLYMWFHRENAVWGGRLSNAFWAVGRRRTAFAGFFLAFSVSLFIWNAWSTVRSVLAERNGSPRVVEGVVTEFGSMRSSGLETESFSVNGVRFRYSDYVSAPGFHQPHSRGGPIRQGLRVRIHYSEPYRTILKLEVAESSSSRTPP